MKERWIEVLYFDGVGIHMVYGTIDGTIDEALLSKKQDEWIRLNSARWLNEDATAMELFEDDIVGTEGHLYLRVSTLIRVAPIREDATFWEEGRAPRPSFEESQENN